MEIILNMKRTVEVYPVSNVCVGCEANKAYTNRRECESNCIYNVWKEVVRQSRHDSVPIVLGRHEPIDNFDAHKRSMLHCLFVCVLFIRNFSTLLRNIEKPLPRKKEV